MTALAWALLVEVVVVACIGWAGFFRMAYLARLSLNGWDKAIELGFEAAARWEACLTPTSTPPSAVTRDAAQGGATTSVPSSFGESGGGTEASATRPAPGVNRDGT